MIAIVESRADRASSHICEHLLELAEWTEHEDDSRPDGDGGGTWYRFAEFELRSFDERHLDLERPVEAFDCDPDFLVFASRHAGETGALLTGHFTGNVGPAEFGGEDHALADACPNALVTLFEAFETYAPEGYDVGLECTHHGPTDVGCPSLFAELGSGDDQWDDPAGAAAVARAILELGGVAPHRDRQVVGFGGSHYVPRFERIVRETPWAVGHVASEWALAALEEADPGPEIRRRVLERAFEASDATVAVVDDDRPDLEALLEDLGYRVVSETWLREVGDRSLEFVERVETTLGTVDDGVRFGESREEFEVVSLPSELVGAAEGIDPDRVWRALERHTVAFETSNGGSRVGAQAAVSREGSDAVSAVNDLVEDLASILREKYDEVRVELDDDRSGLGDDDDEESAGAVVVTEVAFDPARARDLGVPEGPAFGTLADRESVTVDGQRITFEDVQTERVHRFPFVWKVSDE